MYRMLSEIQIQLQLTWSNIAKKNVSRFNKKCTVCTLMQMKIKSKESMNEQFFYEKITRSEYPRKYNYNSTMFENHFKWFIIRKI